MTAEEIDAWAAEVNRRRRKRESTRLLVRDTVRTLGHAARICRKSELVNIAAALEELVARWEAGPAAGEGDAAGQGEG